MPFWIHISEHQKYTNKASATQAAQLFQIIYNMEAHVLKYFLFQLNFVMFD